MKRTKRIFVLVVSAMLVVQLFTISAFASERKDEPIITLAETRSASEMNNLRSIYAQLFPNELKNTKKMVLRKWMQVK